MGFGAIGALPLQRCLRPFTASYADIRFNRRMGGKEPLTWISTHQLIKQISDGLRGVWLHCQSNVVYAPPPIYADIRLNYKSDEKNIFPTR